MARPSSVPGVTASDIPCKEKGVATQMGNYMLWCLPIFKVVITMHLFYGFIALEVSVILVKVIILLCVSKMPLCKHLLG